MYKIKRVPKKTILIIIICILLIIIFIRGFLTTLLLIFWQSKSDEEIKVMVLDVPPAPNGQGFNRQLSKNIYNAIYPLSVWQNPPIEKIQPSILKAFQVDYVVIWEREYKSYFESLLEKTEYDFFPQIYKVNKKSLKNKDLFPFFSHGQGWYEIEEDRQDNHFIWIGEQATFYYYLPERKNTFGLTFNYIKQRFIDPPLIHIKGKPIEGLTPEAKIRLNLNKQEIKSAVFNNGEVNFSLPNLKNGLNIITLESEKGCVAPESLDEPCLSFMISQIEISL